VVERGGGAEEALSDLAGLGEDLLTTSVSSPDEAAAEFAARAYDCVVLGPGLPKSAALRLIDRLSESPRARETVFVLHPARPLLAREHAHLRRLGDAVATRVVETSQQLSAEAAVALHRKPARPLAQPSGEGAIDSGALRGAKVLLVDDDVRNLFALASLLEDRGIVVVFGETGKEALAALERHEDIDLVLMDIMMPDMDGNETIAAIRRTPRLTALPIIAVTAKAMEGDREKSLSVGASDYITKPVEPERLLSLIGSWLRR
jgi:CheY-like chemotaxis protein